MLARVLHSTGVQHRLGDLLSRQMAAANLLGRVQIVDEVKRRTGKRVPIATSSRLHTHFDDDDIDALLSGGFSVNLPNDAAAEHLRQLTPVTKDTFDGLSSQYKRDAITVAGAVDARLIQKIRDELADILHQGGTKEQFEAAVNHLTSEAGVKEINAFTLDTVFTTNMAKAYALGRYEQQMSPDTVEALPFGQYMTVGDDRVRPEHQVLDGFTARMDDAVWRKIYPPCGFNCRCIRVALLPGQVDDIEEATRPGMTRLPALARAKVPQPGFTPVL
jgi:SPP1 gp7 family putative phage head morphogenesis protein